MAILLIRHGQTDFNANRVVQLPHTPLGITGLDQAQRLGQRLADHPITTLLTSDYLRARTTAEHIADHAKVRLVESPLLRERNFGELRGQSYESFGSLDVFAPEYEPPGGESWPVFHARVDRAWEEILAYADKNGGDIAIVTHGLVLRSLLERKLDASDHPMTPDLVVSNTSVTTVDATPPWKVRTLACVAHLEQPAAIGGAV